VRLRRLIRKLRLLTRAKKKVIRRYRHDISNKDVLEKIKQGWSVRKCSDHFNCSKNLILAVVNGTRPEAPPIVELSKKEMCTCCLIRPRKKGNRFLCEYCFENKGDADIDIYTVEYGDHIDYYIE